VTAVINHKTVDRQIGRRECAYSSYSLTDCGNAERLVDHHGESIRFCGDKREWFVWNGCRWTADQGAVVQLAKKTIRAMQVERNHLLSQSEYYPDGWEILRRHADGLSNWAKRSEGVARIIAMLRLAESDPRVTIGSQDFDRDSWVLNLRNGTIDLRSARFREHKPEELLTKVAGPTYEPDARCDRWQRFLEEVFEPHPEVIPFLQKAIGYTLTGDTREECVFVLRGTGRNGKSTLIGVLHQLFASYGGVAEIETFLASRRSALREDIADMCGRRFVSAQEPMMTGMFAESTLKWLSGGDRLRARRLYEHAQEFHPTHKLWLAVNRLPALRMDDCAAWSRLRVIPFDVSFTNKADRELKHELQSELSGILRWALHGCLLWQKTGLGSTPSIESATQKCRTGRKRVA
jgi:putative DNA primase/helicase